MKLLEKRITPANYKKCFTCATYRMSVLPVLQQAYPNKSIQELMRMSPNCMWFIEHVLNGNEMNTNNCMFYININRPKYIN